MYRLWEVSHTAAACRYGASLEQTLRQIAWRSSLSWPINRMPPTRISCRILTAFPQSPRIGTRRSQSEWYIEG